MAITINAVTATSFNTGSGNPTRAYVSLTNPSLLVAVVTYESKTGSLSVSDPTNGTWTQDVTNNGGNGAGEGKCEIWSVQNTGTAGLTVTLTIGTASYGYFQIYEVTGAATSSALDSTQSGADEASNSDNSISHTTLSDNCALFHCGTFYGGTASADSGYTEGWTNTALNNAYHYGEYIADAGAAGAKTLTFTDTGTKNNWCSVSAAYKIAGGGGGGSGNPWYAYAQQ